jgi:alkaline phosphatase D
MVVFCFCLLSPVHAQPQILDISRIAFGSCNHQDKPQPIWDEVLAAEPDLFVFLGDNIYADTDDPLTLQATYDKLAAVPGYQALRQEVEVIATWDDHDYGQNDIGREYLSKDASRQIMLDFFDEPPDSERRSRPDGIYTSYFYGNHGRRVQIILLDLRWNRSPLVEVMDTQRLAERTAAHMGPYEASLSASAELLGESQWQWLEHQLQMPADLRIIGSSIQLLADFTGWETWANYPRDRQRLFEVLERYQREPVIIISGDVHWAELSEIRDSDLDWPLIELTSSGLTEEWSAISPNRHRVGEAFAEANYGLIDIDWSQETPSIHLRIKNEIGEELISHRVEIP